MCLCVWKRYWIIILASQICNSILNHCSCLWMWFRHSSWPSTYICIHRRVSVSPSLPPWHWCMSGCIIDLMVLDLQDLFLQTIDVSPPVVCSVVPLTACRQHERTDVSVFHSSKLVRVSMLDPARLTEGRGGGCGPRCDLAGECSTARGR